MSEIQASILPYRVGGEELTKMITARARGRALPQIQAALNFSTKSFEGTLSTAQTFGFLESETGKLTERGRKFALSSIDDRRAILLKALLNYEPYDLLFEALSDRTETATPLDWIETWWNTHGFGNSQSNRSEGSTAFARLVEYLDLGKYYQGRRGHVTRIEWNEDAVERVRNTRIAIAKVRSSDETETVSGDTERDGNDGEKLPALEISDAGYAGFSNNDMTNQISGSHAELRIVFGPNRVATLRAPPALTIKEKERLIGALDHLIAIEEEGE